MASLRIFALVQHSDGRARGNFHLLLPHLYLQRLEAAVFGSDLFDHLYLEPSIPLYSALRAGTDKLICRLKHQEGYSNEY